MADLHQKIIRQDSIVDTEGLCKGDTDVVEAGFALIERISRQDSVQVIGGISNRRLVFCPQEDFREFILSRTKPNDSDFTQTFLNL